MRKLFYGTFGYCSKCNHDFTSVEINVKAIKECPVCGAPLYNSEVTEEKFMEKYLALNAKAQKPIQGYKIICVDGNYILAHNPKAVQPFVVWRHNGDLEAYWGHYFNTIEEADLYFAEKAQLKAEKFLD